MRRLIDANYRVLDRMRHHRAFEVAREPGTEKDFAGFRGSRQCLVVTFKRRWPPTGPAR